MSLDTRGCLGSTDFRSFTVVGLAQGVGQLAPGLLRHARGALAHLG